MIIVTGGAGFIGSNIVHELNVRGRTDILIVDNLGTGDKYKNLMGLHFIDYQHMDDFLTTFTKNDFFGLEIDAIFHEGACSDTMEYDVNYMMKTNYEYSKALLNFCINRQVPFIYASSASVYGNGKKGFREVEECENALNPYAFSKLMFDRYVRQFIDDAKSKVIGLRYFNVFGPQEQHKDKMASIFHQIYKRMKLGGKFVKLYKGTDGYADGEQQRDFVYVKDVVKVNLWCMENNLPNGIYNCGTGKAQTFNSAAQAMIDAHGSGKIEYTPFPDELRGKYQNFTQADMRKLIGAGYKTPFTPLNSAVREYYQFMENGGYYSYV
ncbi:MAG: ADP-glyceromanno-heptose 6-epimerase [Selenomonadaceae bacterium]|nr:ADP-glyceromanno-heptose 6-epimerase [Selenomonadaceae bacterium]